MPNAESAQVVEGKPSRADQPPPSGRPRPPRRGSPPGLPRAEQWEAGEDLLKLHHLARHVLRNRERHDIDHTIDVGDHAARLGTGKPAKVGTKAQPDLVRVDRVEVELTATLVAPKRCSRPTSSAPSDRSASGSNTVNPTRPRSQAGSGRSSHACRRARPGRRRSWPAVGRGAQGRRDR